MIETNGSWGHEPRRRFYEYDIDEFGFLNNLYEVFDGKWLKLMVRGDTHQGVDLTFRWGDSSATDLPL